jgi:hypothetical protein
MIYFVFSQSTNVRLRVSSLVYYRMVVWACMSIYIVWCSFSLNCTSINILWRTHTHTHYNSLIYFTNSVAIVALAWKQFPSQMTYCCRKSWIYVAKLFEPKKWFLHLETQILGRITSYAEGLSILCSYLKVVLFHVVILQKLAFKTFIMYNANFEKY